MFPSCGGHGLQNRLTNTRCTHSERSGFYGLQPRRIFNLIDKNLLKQYLKVLSVFFATLRVIFKAFYTLFSFENMKWLFLKRILIVV